jgi:hypothetical protein
MDVTAWKINCITQKSKTMLFNPYPPIDATASSRNDNLEGNPTALVEGIEFFLEIQTLLTGKNDSVKRRSLPTNDPRAKVERIWLFTGLPELQPPIEIQTPVGNQTPVENQPPAGTQPSGGKK